MPIASVAWRAELQSSHVGGHQDCCGCAQALRASELLFVACRLLRETPLVNDDGPGNTLQHWKRPLTSSSAYSAASLQPDWKKPCLSEVSNESTSNKSFVQQCSMRFLLTCWACSFVKVLVTTLCLKLLRVLISKAPHPVGWYLFLMTSDILPTFLRTIIPPILTTIIHDLIFIHYPIGIAIHRLYLKWNYASERLIPRCSVYGPIYLQNSVVFSG